jgi:hypothetical protein
MMGNSMKYGRELENFKLREGSMDDNEIQQDIAD